MTISEFVLNQNPQSINDWIKLIKECKLSNYEDAILKCADYYGKIIINHSACFTSAINY